MLPPITPESPRAHSQSSTSPEELLLGVSPQLDLGWECCQERQERVGYRAELPLCLQSSPGAGIGGIQKVPAGTEGFNSGVKSLWG